MNYVITLQGPGDRAGTFLCEYEYSRYAWTNEADKAWHTTSIEEARGVLFFVKQRLPLTGRGPCIRTATSFMPQPDCAPQGTEHVTVRVPAYSEVLGESILLENFPADWAARIEKLAPRLCYGPNFSRAILFNVKECRDLLKRGYSSLAYDHLVHAERAAAGWPLAVD